MDSIERLECVYYSGPIPSDRAVLTTLCFIFDKIHFPGVYLPKGDYDKDLLQHEIARLEALKDKSYETMRLIGAMKFLEYRIPLDGILEYPTSDSIFGRGKDVKTEKIARTIYDVHFPPKENFEPFFDSAHLKALPDSKESIEYMGDFYYQAEAISYADRNQMVIPPKMNGVWCRTHAAICVFICRLSFWAGVMPPRPMLGRSLL